MTDDAMQSQSGTGYPASYGPSGAGQPLPAYPPPPPIGNATLPGYPPNSAAYAPPTKRRVPWWGQLLALVLPTVIAFLGGAPIWFLLLRGTYGDSTPPPNAGTAVAWLTAAYVCVAVICGLGVHAIVIRKPWFVLLGFAATAIAVIGMVAAYANLWTGNT